MPDSASSRRRDNSTDVGYITRAEFDALLLRVLVLERLRPEQAETLRRLLPLIFAAVGDSVFTVADLFQGIAAAKHVALAEAVGRHTSRSLGKTFQRAAGLSVAGYSVQRVSSPGANGAAVWKIERV